jgi:DNA-3-methyladenine glycosylase II
LSAVADGAATAGRHAEVLVREVVRPPWTFRLGGGSMDGLLRRRGDGLVRLVHEDGDPVAVAVAQTAPDRVVFAARAATEAAARAGIARLRFATGVDDDLAAFHARFRDDPVIGRAVRSRPGLRVRRNPHPWETLAWAITEQLIDFERATLIQKRLIRALGPRCAHTGLRDSPGAALVAAQAPALLERCGLAAKRALAMRRAAAAVAAGRIDLAPPPAVVTGGSAAAPAAPAGRAAAAAPPPPGDLSAEPYRRLLAMREIGPWTVEMLALHGQGRLDVVPAADLGYLKLVGRLVTGGNPRAFADEAEVRGFFSAYAPWAGLAGEYLRTAAATGLLGRDRRAPVRAATRRSASPVPA